MTEDTERGLYRKYEVERLNDPDDKHGSCSYFVLDLDHDVHARAALEAYADSCKEEYPELAADLRRMLRGREGFFEHPSVPFSR